MVLLVCGSLAKESQNRQLLRAIEPLLAERGAASRFTRWLEHLPLFSPDLERGGEHAVVGRFRAEVQESAGLVIACPEYGHSLPGALKNAVDWLIGSGELDQLPVLLTASVPHLDRGQRGLGALETVMTAVNAQSVGTFPVVRGHDVGLVLGSALDELVTRGKLFSRV